MRHNSIILIENDVNLRQSIVLILQRAGYSVIATDCVYTALEILKRRTCHLLVCDVSITETEKVLNPEMMEIYPHLPLIILTDESIAEVERDKLLFNAHYITKPIAPESLLDYVSAILTQKDPPRYHNKAGFSLKNNSMHR
ncbi:MAG TPA: response regulator [Anaerolineales bacterium]|nr:response regulator [Anaerolineales bacterium]